MKQPEPDMKKKILLAAKKLFARQGFDGTSVRQICDDAGANVALVSYHFGGKENVFFALFDTFFPRNKLARQEHLLQDPVEGIQWLLGEVIRFRMMEPELHTILHQEIILGTPRSRKLRAYTFPVWMKLRELLEKGRKKGCFHFRSLDHTMLFVMGTVLYPKNAGFIEPLLTEGRQGTEEVVKDTLQFVLGGLGAESTLS